MSGYVSGRLLIQLQHGQPWPYGNDYDGDQDAARLASVPRSPLSRRERTQSGGQLSVERACVRAYIC